MAFVVRDPVIYDGITKVHTRKPQYVSQKQRTRRNETWVGISEAVYAHEAYVTQDNMEIRGWGSDSTERSTESSVEETSGSQMQKIGLWKAAVATGRSSRLTEEDSVGWGHPP